MLSLLFVTMFVGFWFLPVLGTSIKADGDSRVLSRLRSLGFHKVIFQTILDSFFFPLTILFRFNRFFTSVENLEYFSCLMRCLNQIVSSFLKPIISFCFLLKIFFPGSIFRCLIKCLNQNSSTPFFFHVEFCLPLF